MSKDFVEGIKKDWGKLHSFREKLWYLISSVFLLLVFVVLVLIAFGIVVFIWWGKAKLFWSAL